MPEADPEWHPLAGEWFASLGRSGQAAFYEASDWLAAKYVADTMSRGLRNSRPSAQLFAAVMSAMGDLLTTEGARRRARVELERGVEAPVSPSVAIMQRYRDAAGS
jgi:hypothetical protein